MRKILSLVMTAVMLFALVAVAIPVSAAGDVDTIDTVQALYFESQPTIDGSISEAEWGAVTFEVNSEDAANKADREPYYNCFFYWLEGMGSRETTLSYQVWLRWDENYFYVGAKVNDPDGHNLRYGKTSTWNGDALQFRIDKDGPNSSGDDGVYNPDIGSPWASPNMIPDIVTGYSQIAGGFFEAYENNYARGLTEYSKPVFGAVKIAIAPSGVVTKSGTAYSTDTAAGITTYEIALPWKYVFDNYLMANYNYALPNGGFTDTQLAPVTLKYETYHFIKNKQGGIGRQLGMSMMMLNSTPGQSSYNSYLLWGSGIGQAQVEEAPGTCAGSNCVILSGDKVNPSAASYQTYDPTQIEKSSLVPGYENVFYDYLSQNSDGTIGDQAKKNPLTSADQLTTLTYDNIEDLNYWGGEYNGEIVDVGGEHGNVLSFDKGEDGLPIVQTYIDTRDFDVDWNFPLTYTIEFDIMYTGNEVVADGYDSSLYNWFGGGTGYDYSAGFYFNDNMFKIMDGSTKEATALAKVAPGDANYVEFKKDTWYNWKFQFDQSSCTMRLIVDGVTVLNFYDRYFYYSDDQHLTNGTMMLFRMMNTQCKYDNVKIYNFYDYTKQDAKPITEGSGGSGGTYTPPVTGGEVLPNNFIKNDDGTYSLQVFAKPDYKKNLTKLSYSINFDATKASLKGVKGLTEGTYTLEEKAAGSYVLTITDLSYFRSSTTGKLLFEFIFEGSDPSIDADAFGVTLQDSYEYTEGDAMLYIVGLIALAALGGTTIAIIRRKKKSVL